MQAYPDTLRLSTPDVLARIERLTTGQADFWKDASGWAPIDAAGLLNRSMLEWQASLSSSLGRWEGSTADGDLILAWANLGALVEGQLKLFLSVYYRDYLADVDGIRQWGARQDPDVCMLEGLRQFFVRRIWRSDENWDDYIRLVQQRRNAIHAFAARDIGTHSEWEAELRRHLSFMRDLNRRLPYPDEQYEPREF